MQVWQKGREGQIEFVKFFVLRDVLFDLLIDKFEKSVKNMLGAIADFKENLWESNNKITIAENLFKE